MGSSSEGSPVCVIFRMSCSGSKFPLWTVFLFMDTWSPLMALLRGQETHGGRGGMQGGNDLFAFGQLKFKAVL